MTKKRFFSENAETFIYLTVIEKYAFFSHFLLMALGVLALQKSCIKERIF